MLRAWAGDAEAVLLMIMRAYFCAALLACSPIIAFAQTSPSKSKTPKPSVSLSAIPAAKKKAAAQWHPQKVTVGAMTIPGETTGKSGPQNKQKKTQGTNPKNKSK